MFQTVDRDTAHTALNPDLIPNRFLVLQMPYAANTISVLLGNDYGATAIGCIRAWLHAASSVESSGQ